MTAITAITIKLFVVIAVVAALWASVWGFAKHHQAIGAAAQFQIDQQAATKLKVEAAKKLADLQIDKQVADKAFADFKNTRDVNYVQSQKQVTNLSNQLRDLGRLYDPFVTASGCGGGSGGSQTRETQTAAVGADNRTKTSGLLSAELTRFLWEKHAEADTINVAYSDCKATLTNLQASPAFAQ